MEKESDMTDEIGPERKPKKPPTYNFRPLMEAAGMADEKPREERGKERGDMLPPDERPALHSGRMEDPVEAALRAQGLKHGKSYINRVLLGAGTLVAGAGALLGIAQMSKDAEKAGGQRNEQLERVIDGDAPKHDAVPSPKDKLKQKPAVKESRQR